MRRLLEGSHGTLPLAPLCRLPENVALEEALAGVVRRIGERLRQEAPPEEAATLLSAAFVLTGLRVPQPTLEQLFRGVRDMRESSGYQFILEEGGREALQRTLLRQGRKKFGSPSEEVVTRINAINDLQFLEQLAEQLLSVSTWDELLNTPR